jgi:hypothetical protein
MFSVSLVYKFTMSTGSDLSSLLSALVMLTLDFSEKMDSEKLNVLTKFYRSIKIYFFFNLRNFIFSISLLFGHEIVKIMNLFDPFIDVMFKLFEFQPSIWLNIIVDYLSMALCWLIFYQLLNLSLPFLSLTLNQVHKVQIYWFSKVITTLTV